MTPGAQQPINAIAEGDSAVTPPSILDNQIARGRRCENATAFGNEQELNKSRFILNLSSCFSGFHNKKCYNNNNNNNNNIIIIQLYFRPQPIDTHIQIQYGRIDIRHS